MKADWKQGLESGQTRFLHVLLQESLASAETEPTRFEEAEIEELTARAEQAVAELKRNREKAVAEFFERPGWRIIIEAQEDSLLQPRGFDPMNILKVTDKEILHLRMLALSCSSGNLQTMGLPALTLAKGPHPFFSGIKRVEIAGFTEIPEINERDGKLTIDSDRLKMVFTNASIMREGSIIRITLHAK
jgi:hypothetical protein